jgi:hypothetical protein
MRKLVAALVVGALGLGTAVVLAVTSPITTTSSTTSSTTTSPPPPSPTGHAVPAAPDMPRAGVTSWRVEYADAFGSCFTATDTACSSGYPRSDNTLLPQTRANGAGNANEIAAFEPAYNDVTTQGLDEECRVASNLGDSYSCGAMIGLAGGSFHWNPGPNTHIVIQFSAKLPANEGNMDPAVWATGAGYAWEIDFPEFSGWNHYPPAGASNTWCGFPFGDPAVPHDEGGVRGTGAVPTFCSSAGANFNPATINNIYTLDENGDVFTTYIDGVQMESRTFSGFNQAQGKLITQNDMREDKTSGSRTDSHFPAAGNDMVIPYLAVYEPSVANNAGTNGPIIVPGTSVG